MSGAARRGVYDPASVPQLNLALGVELDAELAVLALTHRSFAYENGGLPTNERLEFLGDSVLGIVITEALYRTHSDLAEGQLAKLRASIVNMHALAGVARTIGLGALIRLGHGEEITGGRNKPSILGDAVEALLGALYLQDGLEATRELIHRLFNELIVTAPQLGAGLDWKTSLQELSAARGSGVPVYVVTEDGPDHEKTFAAVVQLAGAPSGEGAGRTKKEAEQRAASIAYTALEAEMAEMAEMAEAAVVSDPVGPTSVTDPADADPAQVSPADD